jgi:hypothetical protein
VELQLVENGKHPLAYVNVTVVVEPAKLQISGAPGLLFVIKLLHPPLAETLASQSAYSVFNCACVRQGPTVRGAGQVSTTAGADATVKVAVQVVVNGKQLLVYVKVTTVLPPQLDGAPILSLVNMPPHPPLALAEFSQATNCALIAACVWQEATVVLIGQVSTTVGGAATVKVAVQVVVEGEQELL